MSHEQLGWRCLQCLKQHSSYKPLPECYLGMSRQSQDRAISKYSRARVALFWTIKMLPKTQVSVSFLQRVNVCDFENCLLLTHSSRNVKLQSLMDSAQTSLCELADRVKIAHDLCQTSQITVDFGWFFTMMFHSFHHVCATPIQRWKQLDLSSANPPGWCI